MQVVSPTLTSASRSGQARQVIAVEDGVLRAHPEAFRGCDVLPLPAQGRVPPEALSRIADAEVVLLSTRERWEHVRHHLHTLHPPRVRVGRLPEGPLTADIVASAASRAAPWKSVALSLSEAAERTATWMSQPRWLSLSSGWRTLDAKLPLKRGELYAVLAYPKVGKTTFCTVVARNLASCGVVVWYASLEERVESLVLRVACSVHGKPRDQLQPGDVRALQGMGWPLLLSGIEELAAVDGGEAFARALRDTHRRYGVDVAVVDNLHYLVRSERDSVERLGCASKLLRSAAAELGVCVVAVLQPRKPPNGGDDPPSAFDARWTGDTVADAHATVVLHRYRSTDPLRDQELEPDMLVRVERSRETPGGDVLMVADWARCQIREATQDERLAFLQRRGVRSGT
jgi:hypothetical protein